MKKIPGTKTLLGLLADYAVKGLTIAMEMQRYQKIYLAGGGHEQVMDLKMARKKADRRDKISQLRRTKFITTKKQGDRLIISLTNKGKRATLLYSLKQAPPTPRGYCTLVIFDIPEDVKQARQVLRLFLKNGGFKQLQKSVWMLNRDVVTILRQFIAEHNLTAWVRVFKAEIAD